jgi:hypothetical protein
VDLVHRHLIRCSGPIDRSGEQSATGSDPTFLVGATCIERTDRAAVRDLCRVNAKPTPPIINGYYQTFGVSAVHHRSSTVITGHCWLSCGRGVIAASAT